MAHRIATPDLEHRLTTELNTYTEVSGVKVAINMNEWIYEPDYLSAEILQPEAGLQSYR